ncbi:Ig-like domain-containing protein, partial [Staphylococcus equorum]
VSSDEENVVNDEVSSGTEEKSNTNTVSPDTVSSDEKNVDNKEIPSTTEEKSNTNTVAPSTVHSGDKNVDNKDYPSATEEKTTENNLYNNKTPKVESPLKNTFTSKNNTSENLSINRENKDVSNQVQVNKNDIESNNIVNPHRGEKSTLKYDLAFENGLKEGNYFDIIISNNVNTHGVSTISKVPEIKNGEMVIAKGSVLENGTIRYVFTNYVNGKNNLKANLSLNLFIDPTVVTENSIQTITSTIGNHKTQKDITVEYLNGVNNAGLGVNGSIVSLDKQNNKFTHIAYINPDKFKIPSATVYG